MSYIKLVLVAFVLVFCTTVTGYSDDKTFIIEVHCLTGIDRRTTAKSCYTILHDKGHGNLYYEFNRGVYPASICTCEAFEKM